MSYISGSRRRQSSEMCIQRCAAYAAKLDHFERDVLETISLLFDDFRKRNCECVCETRSRTESLETDDSPLVPSSRLPQPSSEPGASRSTTTPAATLRGPQQELPQMPSIIMVPDGLINSLTPAQIALGHPTQDGLHLPPVQLPYAGPYHPPQVPVCYAEPHSDYRPRAGDGALPQLPTPWDRYKLQPAPGGRQVEDDPVSPKSQALPYRFSSAPASGILYYPTAAKPFPMPTGPPLADSASLQLREGMYSLPSNPRRKLLREDSGAPGLPVHGESRVSVNSGTGSSTSNLDSEERPTKRRKFSNRDGKHPVHLELSGDASAASQIQNQQSSQIPVPRPSAPGPTLRRSTRLAKREP